MQWPLFIIQGLFGLALITSYGVVLVNLGGGFPLDGLVSTSYIDSPYWLGMPKDTIVGIVVLQILAAIGYLIWFFWLINTEISIGLLRYNWIKTLQIVVFLLSSVIWPYTAYIYMLRPTSVTRAIISSSFLWLAACSVIFMIGTTFEARAPVAPTLGILFLGNVVILADGIGWSALAIYNSLNYEKINIENNQLTANTLRIA
jgi:hypothetical protein